MSPWLDVINLTKLPSYQKEEITMKIKWQKLIMKICFWLLVEVIYNLIGIDELADYSEFVLMPKTTVQSERFLAG